jgi:hypothetical protein
MEKHFPTESQELLNINQNLQKLVLNIDTILPKEFILKKGEKNQKV